MSHLYIKAKNGMFIRDNDQGFTYDRTFAQVFTQNQADEILSKHPEQYTAEILDVVEHNKNMINHIKTIANKIIL